MKSVALFDLGDTLINNYRPHQFPAILEQCIASICEHLRSRGIALPPEPVLQERVKAENHESPDWKVRPLEGRLARIFDLDLDAMSADEKMAACRAFTNPITEVAWIYPETVATLTLLREKGLRIGIISNTTWGTPGQVWRDQTVRHGIAQFCEHMVFCTDAGYRKPARQIFDLALERFGCGVEDCFMVGDLMQTDIAGARAIGMDAVLVDRLDEHANENVGVPRIRTLEELWGVVSQM